MAISINLLPTKDKNRFSQSRLSAKIFVLSILCLAVAVGITASLFFYLTILKSNNQDIQTQISEYRTRINTLKPIQEKYSYLSNSIDQITTLQSKGLDYRKTIAQISSLVPSGLKINTLQLTSLPAQSFSLTATAIDRRTALSFYEKMKATPNFADTKIQSFDSGSSGSIGTSGTVGSSIQISLITTITSAAPTASPQQPQQGTTP